MLGIIELIQLYLEVSTWDKELDLKIYNSQFDSLLSN